MTHRRHDGQPPLWLDIALQPGVIEVLAALSNRGEPLRIDQICEHVGVLWPDTVVRAVCRLGAYGLLRRDRRHAGSWDEPGPSTHVELTERGHGYAQALGDLGRWATQRLPGARLDHQAD